MKSKPLHIEQVDVLGYSVAKIDLDTAAQWCLDATKDKTPKLLVTTNPEIIIQAEQSPELKNALLAADLTVADGVGVVWAAKQFGYELPGRVSGVDLVPRVLESGNDLSVYFLGSKPGVAERAANTVKKRYSTTIAGVQHGYFKRPDEVPEILNAIRNSGADLLLAGLGEGQELFLHQYRAELNIPLMIGVGGTLDVLAGEVTRTPLWTRKVGLEWAYRVGSDPKRWHRSPRLLQFMRLVWREKNSG